MVHFSAKARPNLNTFDVPEMMPGSVPRANPAARYEFTERCKQLHVEAQQEGPSAPVASHASGPVDLVAAFPNLDATLVHAIVADSPTTQHALETLLALAGALSEPSGSVPRAAPPPRDLGTCDLLLFPSLTDSDGWQVPSKRGFELDDEADKTDWRDRTKAAADLPGPTWQPRVRMVPGARRKKAPEMLREAGSDSMDACAPEAEADHLRRRHELRQKHSRRRATKHAHCGLPIALNEASGKASRTGEILDDT
jgi:hypothetical protein